MLSRSSVAVHTDLISTSWINFTLSEDIKVKVVNQRFLYTKSKNKSQNIFEQCTVCTGWKLNTDWRISNAAAQVVSTYCHSTLLERLKILHFPPDMVGAADNYRVNRVYTRGNESSMAPDVDVRDTQDITNT
jgi:hypothetical protein